MTSQPPLGIITSIASKIPSIHQGVSLKYWLQSCARELLPNERVSNCLRLHAPLKTNVEIHKAREGKTAFYKGLQVCGSVWHCPVCASRISSERKRELSEGISRWNGRLLLATYTLSHSRDMKLTDMIAAELDAYRSLKSGDNFQRIKENFGWFGSVRTIEITYGANGWHPHLHELVFIEMGKTKIMDTVYTGNLKAEIFRDWKRHLNKRGYGAEFTHGVDIRTASDSVADYVAKFGREPINPEWSVSDEMTRQPSKKAREGGHTPTALLFDYGEGEVKFGRLWREYAMTMKGKHQLEWSRGMRAVLGLGIQKGDGEIADEIPKDTYLLATLNKEQWRLVLQSDSRGEVLKHAGEDTPEDFAHWLGDSLERWDGQVKGKRGYNPYIGK